MGTIAFPNVPADAQAISQAPQNALAEYARVSALKQQTALEQQQTQAAQLENQKQQLALNDQQAMTKAMQQWDGKDMSALPDLMRKNGISAGGYLQAQQGIVARQQALTNLDKDQLANMQAHHDAALGVLTSAQQVPDEQLTQHITDSVNNLVAQGHLSQQDGNAVIQHAQSMPPDQFRPWLSVYEKSLQGEKAQIAQAQAESETSKNTAEGKKAEAEAANANKQVIPELGVIVDKSNGTVQPIQGATGGMMPPQMMESKYVALQAAKNAGQLIAPKDAAWMKGYEKMKTLVPQFNLNMQNNAGAGQPAAQVAKSFGMTPEAFDQQAEKFYSTGQLPPIGRGGNGQALNKAIMNRAADLHPEGVLAVNSAEYKANSASLSKLQTQADAVNSFENTALKNLDIFLNAAKNVPDLGARFANVPLRMITGKMIGEQNQAALNAARQTALTEVAKVLNSAQGNGVLSDSARKEVDDLLSGNLPLPAMIKTVETLKSDMENRRQSYQDQIDNIHGRLGGKPQNQGASSGAASGGDFFSQFGGKKR